jgi:hypothetical protein
MLCEATFAEAGYMLPKESTIRKNRFRPRDLKIPLCMWLWITTALRNEK